MHGALERALLRQLPCALPRGRISTVRAFSDAGAGKSSSKAPALGAPGTWIPRAYETKYVMDRREYLEEVRWSTRYATFDPLAYAAMMVIVVLLRFVCTQKGVAIPQAIHGRASREPETENGKAREGASTAKGMQFFYIID